MSLEKFDIRKSANGDTVIGFTSVKSMKTLGWLDKAKVSTYLMDGENSYRKHLGLINLFAGSHKSVVPFMRDLFVNSAVMELEEGQSLTYDMAVDRPDELCYTAEDTSNESDFPGIDGSVFPIVLNHEYTKGDILTYDFQNGDQVMVSNDHEVEQVGENYRHYVVLSTNDKTAYFPKDYLKSGIQWAKVGHVIGEFETDYSSINLSNSPAGTITNEFVLGDPMGISAFYTAKAGLSHAAGLTAVTDGMRENVMAQLDAMGGSARDMFWLSSPSATGINQNGMMIGTTLEYLMLMELNKMECHKLLFAKAATFRTANGSKMVNEGVYHQIRRGKVISYPRAGAITIDHIQEAAAYIFRASNIEPADRVIKFKGGYNAIMNLKHIFREEAISQLNGLPAGMLGTTAQVQPVFSGPLNALVMAPVGIAEVTVPGIGRIQYEHDPSLDYRPMADRRSQGFGGEGMADTSYSLTIWDATDPQYSNISKVKGANLVEGGNKKANIYYIKPTGSHLVYGYEQGRMANNGSMANVQSSMKVMGREIWATSHSAALILDTTRYVTIELQR